jgi:hypothetical protein
MQNTAAEEESLKGVTISEDCFAKLQFVIMRPVLGAILGFAFRQWRSNSLVIRKNLSEILKVGARNPFVT